MEIEDAVLTVTEFAQKIGSTKQTVLKMIKEGRIIAFRLSDGRTGRWRIKSSEIERLISLQLHKREVERNHG